MEGDAQNRGVAVPILRRVRHDGQTRGHPGVVEPLPDRIRVRYADPALATTPIDTQWISPGRAGNLPDGAERIPQQHARENTLQSLDIVSL
jgi:hypothetical protein